MAEIREELYCRRCKLAGTKVKQWARSTTTRTQLDINDDGSGNLSEEAIWTEYRCACCGAKAVQPQIPFITAAFKHAEDEKTDKAA